MNKRNDYISEFIFLLDFWNQTQATQYIQSDESWDGILEYYKHFCVSTFFSY